MVGFVLCVGVVLGQGEAGSIESLDALVARFEERRSALPAFVLTSVSCGEHVVYDVLPMLDGKDPIGDVLEAPFDEVEVERWVRVECCVLRPEGWARFTSGSYRLRAGEADPPTVAELWALPGARWECGGPRVWAGGDVATVPGDRWAAPKWLTSGYLSPMFAEYIGLCPRIPGDPIDDLRASADGTRLAGVWNGTGPDGEGMALQTVTVENGETLSLHGMARLTLLRGEDPAPVARYHIGHGLDPRGQRLVVSQGAATAVGEAGGRLYAREWVAQSTLTDLGGRFLLELGASVTRVQVRTEHPLLNLRWPLVRYNKRTRANSGPPVEAIFGPEAEANIAAVAAFEPARKVGERG